MLGRGRPGGVDAAEIKKAVLDLATVGGVLFVEALTLIPAGCFLIGVTTEVITTVSGTGTTSFAVGDNVDPDIWGGTLPLPAGGKSDQTDFTVDGFAQFTVASRVRLTAEGTTPVFDAGLVRITVHYLQIFS